MMLFVNVLLDCGAACKVIKFDSVKGCLSPIQEDWLPVEKDTKRYQKMVQGLKPQNHTQIDQHQNYRAEKEQPGVKGKGSQAMTQMNFV